MNINQEIKLDIKSCISEKSGAKFKEDLQRIEIKEFNNLKHFKYILIQLFIQLGRPEFEDVHVLDYRNKSDIYIHIQPKIKNYITFKTKASLDRYIEEEMTEDDLYLVKSISNGYIQEI